MFTFGPLHQWRVERPCFLSDLPSIPQRGFANYPALASLTERYSSYTFLTLALRGKNYICTALPGLKTRAHSFPFFEALIESRIGTRFPRNRYLARSSQNPSTLDTRSCRAPRIDMASDAIDEFFVYTNRLASFAKPQAVSAKRRISSASTHSRAPKALSWPHKSIKPVDVSFPHPPSYSHVSIFTPFSSSSLIRVPPPPFPSSLSLSLLDPFNSC